MYIYVCTYQYMTVHTHTRVYKIKVTKRSNAALVKAARLDDTLHTTEN